MNNLPDGVTPSMIPGNSSREIAMERAMEEAEEVMTQHVYFGLGMANGTLVKGFGGDVEHAQAAIREASQILEEVQEKLENAGAILDRVIDGDEPEHDD